MGFIRELYYNNISAQDIPKQYEGSLKDLASQIDTTYKNMTETLFEPSKAQFMKYAEMVEKFMDDSLLVMFETGFRLGGQCVFDVFMGNKGAEHEEK